MTEKTLADYVAIALSPVLIMALVGSLVFFLVEVLYVGQYQDVLLWILFFFVFGAVLIARISMHYAIANRAGMYGAILGLLVWLALRQYVEYPDGSALARYGWAVNLGLIVLIWWCAHRLTWDCTLIDDGVDASGQGLMQVAGLESEAGALSAAEVKAAGKKPRKRKESSLDAWWQRYQRYREERAQRPHAPGVWVVYFSLAALPLFGLGQALIPPADLLRRRHAFWLLTVYVGSGLGLLLTTSFLGLRRYLRQRKLQMPLGMTAVWLTLGTALVGALLVVGALLPRPTPEYASWAGSVLLGSRNLDASRLAVKGGSPGKGEGRPGSQAAEDEEGDPAERGRAGKQKASGTNREGSQAPESSKGEPSSGTDKGARTPGKGTSKEKGQGQGRRADGDRRGERSAEPGNQPDPSAPTSLPNVAPEWLGSLGPLLKWLVLGAFALLIAFLLLRALLSFLANFTGWAHNLLTAWAAFWKKLWDRGSKATAEEPGGEAVPAPPPPRPFSSFRDPFTSGSASRQSPGELIRYSFEALQAWAREHGLPRQSGETPLEFAERVAQEVPALEADVRRLTALYAGLAYAERSPGEECRADVLRFWRMLTDVVERPLSAGV